MEAGGRFMGDREGQRTVRGEGRWRGNGESLSVTYGADERAEKHE